MSSRILLVISCWFKRFESLLFGWNYLSFLVRRMAGRFSAFSFELKSKWGSIQSCFRFLWLFASSFFDSSLLIHPLWAQWGRSHLYSGAHEHKYKWKLLLDLSCEAFHKKNENVFSRWIDKLLMFLRRSKFRFFCLNRQTM